MNVRPTTALKYQAAVWSGGMQLEKGSCQWQEQRERQAESLFMWFG
jgi:hypothetical protein